MTTAESFDLATNANFTFFHSRHKADVSGCLWVFCRVWKRYYLQNNGPAGLTGILILLAKPSRLRAFSCFFFMCSARDSQAQHHWQDSHLYWLHETTQNSNQAGWCTTKTLLCVKKKKSLWFISPGSRLISRCEAEGAKNKIKLFRTDFNQRKQTQVSITSCWSDSNHRHRQSSGADLLAVALRWHHSRLMGVSAGCWSSGVKRWNTRLGMRSHKAKHEANSYKDETVCRTHH